MELRVLQYFLAVAREQSITRAAEALHLTQPTLSRQMKELEQALDKQLLIRGSRKVTLTEEGLLLRKRAEEILDLVNRTEQELQCPAQTIAGELYIGTGETDGIRPILQTAQSLQQTYPQLRFHLVSGDGVDVSEQLEKGLLDFGVLLGDFDKGKYHCMPLPGKDVWGVLMRRDSPLAQKEGVSPQDLWDKPLILSRQMENKAGLHAWLCREPGQLNVVATYNLIYNASLMVDEGMGYAFSLDKLINTTGSGLCFRPLKPRLELGMHLVWKKYQMQSKAAVVFLSALRQELARENPVGENPAP